MEDNINKPILIFIIRHFWSDIQQKQLKSQNLFFNNQMLWHIWSLFCII